MEKHTAPKRQDDKIYFSIDYNILFIYYTFYLFCTNNYLAKQKDLMII